MALILLVAGGFFALLFILNMLLQTVRGRLEVGFFSTLFAFLAALVTLAALIVNQTETAPLPIIWQGAVAIAVVIVVLSILAIFADSRQPQYRLRDARGLLGLGIGVLIVIAVFSVPVLATQVLPIPPVTEVDIAALLTAEPTATPQAEEARTSNSESAARATSTLVPTIPSTPTTTRTPRPSATATNTRMSFSTRTPTLTATLPNPCLVLVNFNLNVRAEANFESEVVIVIPFNTSVAAHAQDETGDWWQVNYEDQIGWVNREFITLTSSCDDLPVQEGAST